MKTNENCLICAEKTVLLDVVDFNKSCEEPKGKFLPISGQPIYYSICSNCNFVSCETMLNWSDDDYLKKVYNDRYIDIDPDYVELRPKSNANLINNTFGNNINLIKHLDYGGGNGLLCKTLKEFGWDSEFYDPFPQKNELKNNLKKYNLITAFEVFEHVPNPNKLMRNITQLIADDGIFIFSTLISDGNLALNKRINWWYCSPRNGHVSLFSRVSLVHLAKKYSFNFASFNDGLHVMFKSIPNWAENVIRIK